MTKTPEHDRAGRTGTEIREIKKLWSQLIYTLLNITCLFLAVGDFLCPRLVEGRCRCTGVSVCRQTNKFLPLTVSSENILRLPHSTVVVSFALTIANWLSFSPVPIVRSNFCCLPASNVITACVGGGGCWIGLLLLNTWPPLYLIT